VAVCEENGDIIYQTENWDISADSGKLIDDWRNHNIHVRLMGVKYSMLQDVEEWLIATNTGKQGHLVGVITPENKYVFAAISPEGNYQVGYMDTARAAGQMKVGGTIRGESSEQSPFDEIRQEIDKEIDALQEAAIAAGQWVEESEGPRGLKKDDEPPADEE